MVVDTWDGGARRDRTADLYNAIVALSQLSYGPKSSYIIIKINDIVYSVMHSFNGFTLAH